MQRLIELLPGLAYDLCVITGDYRGKTFGPIDATIAGMARVCSHLVAPIYGVLGNHDSIRMVPALEEMGIRVLLNEAETIERGGRRIHLVGIDDAHYYRLDSIEKAVSRLPDDEFSILLSHTPEIYRVDIKNPGLAQQRPRAIVELLLQPGPPGFRRDLAQCPTHCVLAHHLGHPEQWGIDRVAAQRRDMGVAPMPGQHR